MSHLLKTLSALLVLSATLVTAPGSALAQAPGVGDLELPDLQPMLAWDRGLDVEQGATPAEGDVDSAALHRTLEKLHLRRQMLTAHQVLAWTAAWTIIAAEVVGMINRVALQSGSIERSALEPGLGIHRGLAGTALATYWTAGVLAWTMPSPSGQRDHKAISEWKTTRDTHIVLSIIHNIAMGIVAVTGVLQANVASPEHWEPLVATHTTAGFVAAGFVMTAAVVIGRL